MGLLSASLCKTMKLFKRKLTATLACIWIYLTFRLCVALTTYTVVITVPRATTLLTSANPERKWRRLWLRWPAKRRWFSVTLLHIVLMEVLVASHWKKLGLLSLSICKTKLRNEKLFLEIHTQSLNSRVTVVLMALVVVLMGLSVILLQQPVSMHPDNPFQCFRRRRLKKFVLPKWRANQRHAPMDTRAVFWRMASWAVVYIHT